MAINFEIFPCSDKALELIKPELLGTGETYNECKNTYGLGRLKIGESICIHMNVGIKRHNLLMVCKGHNKRHQVNVKVITHDDLQVFELVRIQNDKPEVKPIKEYAAKRTDKDWNTYNVNEGVPGAEDHPYYKYKIFNYEEISDKAKYEVSEILIGKGECEPNAAYQRYPFKQLNIGQAFYILEDEGIHRTSLETCRKNVSEKTGRYFRVIRHRIHKCYEVVRIK